MNPDGATLSTIPAVQFLFMNTRFFRALGSTWCSVVVLFFAGCDSILPQSLDKMKFVQTHEFPEDEETVHAASQSALEAMNYVVVRGSRAGGTLEMASRVQPGSALQVRQRRAVLEITPVEGGGCSLRIAFWEASEDKSAGGTVTATNRLLREGTIYQVFWDHLAEKLSESAAENAAKAP